MNREEITLLFDQQAPNFDKQWEKMSQIHEGLYFLMESLLLELPQEARVLCVGAGTGREVKVLAKHNPAWEFTVVEPSAEMIAQCHDSLAVDELTSRCEFHEGFLDTLPPGHPHDAATCFNVSHFLLERVQRVELFADIAQRLKRAGLMISSDLCFDTQAPNYQTMLPFWFSVMSGADISPENIERMKSSYDKDVAIASPHEILSIITEAGFQDATPFYQAGLIQAFFARRA